MYYPLFLDLRQAHCLVVGGGEVGLRKVQGLVAAKAQKILVLDKAPFSALWYDIGEHPSVHLECRSFCAADIEGQKLVFACTGHRESNAYIAHLCAVANILCNCVDAPQEGNCIVPATIRSSANTLKNTHEHTINTDTALTLALSTGGGSPAWTRLLRRELEEWLQARQAMTVLMGRLRPLVLALKKDTGHNTALFRAVVHSPLRDALASGDKLQSQEILQNILPKSLHAHIAELLYAVI